VFNSLYNQARILYQLEPVTGLLIKSGKESGDPTRPDMEFIRTFADVGGHVQETPFLPGSSLKGIVRSHAERILRTINLIECDITLQNGACVAGREGEKPPYRDHCFACRTFGYTTLSSHVRFTDAFPWRPNDDAVQRVAGTHSIQIEQRPGVQISRRMGSVAHGPFELEVATGGVFYGEIVVRNYQLWQLALLACVLRDINEGYQRLGAMKSRGLGRVKVTIEEMSIEQCGLLARPNGIQVRGIGATQHLVGSYDLIGEDAIDKPNAFQDKGDSLLRMIFTPSSDIAPNEAWGALADAIISSGHWQRLLRLGEDR
jgi:CRISPR-associated protein Csm3